MQLAPTANLLLFSALACLLLASLHAGHAADEEQHFKPTGAIPVYNHHPTLRAGGLGFGRRGSGKGRDKREEATTVASAQCDCKYNIHLCPKYLCNPAPR